MTPTELDRLVAHIGEEILARVGPSGKTPKKGVAIYSVDPGSAADTHRFYYGDYIHDINHKVINSMSDLCDVLQSHEGEVITISGKEIDTGRGYSEPLRVR